MSNEKLGIYETLKDQDSLKDSVSELTEILEKDTEHSKHLSTYGQKKILKTLMNNYTNEGEIYGGLDGILEDVEKAEKDRNFMNPTEFTKRISNLRS